MEYNWKKNATVFLVSQAISLFGSSLVQYAITWHITLSTKSGVFTMLAIVCGFLPTLFLSPFAGVWADRYSRKLLIVLADGGIALSTLVLALLFMGGHDEIWLLLVALGIRALGGAVQMPCINAMLPDIVPTEHLTRVNGINGSLQSLITLVSPMLSGALMGFASLPAIFFIDVVTAAVAIGVMLLWLRLPAKEEKPKPQPGEYFREMREGFRYVGSHAYLRNFFILCVMFFFVWAPISFLTPLQVARNYGDDVWRLTAIEVVFSVGMLAGGLLISAWGGFKNRVHTMALTAFIMALGTIALGLPMRFGLYLVIMGAIGLMMPLFNTSAVVLLQERTDPDYMGRIFGVMTMISSSVMPIGMLVFGPVADVVPIEYLLLITGVAMVALCAVMMRNKPLVEAGGPLSH